MFSCDFHLWFNNPGGKALSGITHFDFKKEKKEVNFPPQFTGIG